jgi:hypothetical protein
MQRRQNLFVETCPHFSDVLQLTLVEASKEQGSKVMAATLWFCETPDHKFLFQIDLHFQPRLRAPLTVGCSRVFADDALETALSRSCKGRDAVIA